MSPKLFSPSGAFWLVGVALVFCLYKVRAQTFDIRSDISVCITNLMLQPAQVSRWSYRARCLVTSNVWFIEHRIGNGRHYNWFTGSNVITHILITKEPMSQDLQEVWRWASKSGSQPGGRLPHYGTVFTNIFPLADGRPPHNMRPTLAWLAFCSGAVLKLPQRELPTPKDGGSYYSDGRFDEASTFKDRFGLPGHVKFYTASSNLVSVYLVHQTTNILGITFPLVFSASQSNSLQMSLISGKVTLLQTIDRFSVPAEVSDVVRPPRLTKPSTFK